MLRFPCNTLPASNIIQFYTSVLLTIYFADLTQISWSLCGFVKWVCDEESSFRLSTQKSRKRKAAVWTMKLLWFKSKRSLAQKSESSYGLYWKALCNLKCSHTTNHFSPQLSNSLCGMQVPFKKSAEPAEVQALFTFFFLIARNHSSQNEILAHGP